MSRVVSCPHCELKLSVRDELVGQRLACPKCKGTFRVPEQENEAPVPEAIPVPAAEEKPSPISGGSELGFLSGLASSSEAKKSKPAPRRPTPTLQEAVKPLLNTVSTKAKAVPLKVWYIAGGAVGFVLLLIIVAGLTCSSDGGRRKPANIKDGLTEKQRKDIFCSLMQAVDNFGMGDSCRREWDKIGAQYKKGSSTLANILDEGFSAGWLQPSLPNYDANVKTRRQAWIKKRTETRTEPMFLQR